MAKFRHDLHGLEQGIEDMRTFKPVPLTFQFEFGDQ